MQKYHRNQKSSSLRFFVQPWKEVQNQSMPIIAILFKLQIQISLHYCVFLLFVNVILVLEGEFMNQNAPPARKTDLPRGYLLHSTE